MFTPYSHNATKVIRQFMSGDRADERREKVLIASAQKAAKTLMR